MILSCKEFFYLVAIGCDQNIFLQNSFIHTIAPQNCGTNAASLSIIRFIEEVTIAKDCYLLDLTIAMTINQSSQIPGHTAIFYYIGYISHIGCFRV